MLPDPSNTLRLVVSVVMALGVVATSMVVAALPSQAAGPTIAITDKLSTKHLSVSPGTTVTWVNRDDEAHRMRAMGGRGVKLDSGSLAPGERWSYTFRSPGDVMYSDLRDRRDPSYVGMVMVERGAGGAEGAARTLAASASTASGDEDDADRDRDEGDGDEEGRGSALPSKVTVEIHNKNEFRPANVRIAPGGTVTWFNDDSHDHTASGTGGIDSGRLHRDQAFSHT
ncbi:MAG: hypothetical protein ACRDOJ_09295, partial [Nocardioidaceae bacterium]